MAFFKRVNLVGPNQEKLQGWLTERYAGIGQQVKVAEDEFGRDWTVSESADQLIMESQVDQRHALTVLDSSSAVEAAPAAIKAPKAPRVSKSRSLAAVDHN